MFHFLKGAPAQIAPTDDTAPTDTSADQTQTPTQPQASPQDYCDPTKNPAITPADQITPEATVTLCDKQGRPYTLGPVRVVGETVDNAQASVNQQSGDWVVQLDFNGEGADAYGALTGEAACQPAGQPQRSIAIVLDDQVVSAPRGRAGRAVQPGPRLQQHHHLGAARRGRRAAGGQGPRARAPLRLAPGRARAWRRPRPCRRHWASTRSTRV